MKHDELPDDHDCRHRVRNGKAERIAVHEELVIQLHYECDICGNDVWVQAERYNIQVQPDDKVFEPPVGTDKSELFEVPLHRVD